MHMDRANINGEKGAKSALGATSRLFSSLRISKQKPAVVQMHLLVPFKGWRPSSSRKVPTKINHAIHQAVTHTQWHHVWQVIDESKMGQKKTTGTDAQTMPSVEFYIFIALAPVKIASCIITVWHKIWVKCDSPKKRCRPPCSDARCLFMIVTGAEQQKQTLHSHKTHKNVSICLQKSVCGTTIGHTWWIFSLVCNAY